MLSVARIVNGGRRLPHFSQSGGGQPGARLCDHLHRAAPLSPPGPGQMSDGLGADRETAGLAVLRGRRERHRARPAFYLAVYRAIFWTHG
jgi:hypothetical protein